MEGSDVLMVRTVYASLVIILEIFAEKTNVILIPGCCPLMTITEQPNIWKTSGCAQLSFVPAQPTTTHNARQRRIARKKKKQAARLHILIAPPKHASSERLARHPLRLGLIVSATTIRTARSQDPKATRPRRSTGTSTCTRSTRSTCITSRRHRRRYAKTTRRRRNGIERRSAKHMPFMSSPASFSCRHRFSETLVSLLRHAVAEADISRNRNVIEAEVPHARVDHAVCAYCHCGSDDSTRDNVVPVVELVDRERAGDQRSA